MQTRQQRPIARLRALLTGLALATALPLAACGTTQPAAPTATAETAPASTVRVPLLVSGTAIGWPEVRTALAEAAGGVVVEETVLGWTLDRECERRGIAVSKRAMQAEEDSLLETIRPRRAGSSADPRALLEAVRAERGLGPVRYAALLRRNAQLRALTAGSVEVTPDEVELAHTVRHGERARIRVIVVRTEREAAMLRRTMTTDPTPEARQARFAAAAVERSTAPSAPAGGAVGVVSPADPALPAGIRSAIEQTPPGTVSPVIAVAEGFALVFVEEQLPADGVSLASARNEIERDLLAQKQRVAMDRYAAGLLGRERITVTDPSLAWSFDARTKR